MPAAVDISLLGDKKLIRKLKRMEPAVQKRIMRKALRAGARPVRDESRRRAPILTGRLKKSIKIRALKRSRNKLGVLVQTGTRAELGIDPDDRYYYPAHVELGHGSVPAIPYLRGALDSKAQEALRIIQREAWNGISAEARKP